MTSTFDGARANPLEDDILALTYSNKDLLDMEPGLYQSKWFDYRLMTPAQATRIYMDAFRDVYRQHFAKEIDARSGQHVQIFDAAKVMQNIRSHDEKIVAKGKQQFASCWRGRQVADAIGMPYREYINLALTNRLRYWQQRHLPRPQHLYSEKGVEMVIERWEEMQRGRLFLAEHEAFSIENYDGIAYQDDYHEWLFKQAQLRSNPFATLATFVNNRQLPLSKVEARYEEDDLEFVRRYLH